MRKFGLLIVGFFFGLILFSGFMTPGTATTESVNDTYEIHIAVLPNNKYNVTSVDLEKNTLYTIYFYNRQPDEAHNLVIATSGRTVTEDTALKQTDEILIGADPNFLTQDDYGAAGKAPWTYNYTTPNEDKYIPFFCSFQGHFAAGMRGYFKVGEPSGNPPFQAPAPGFEFILGIIIVFGLATYRLRKRKV